MEELEYLIRTLTYKRSCLELEWKKFDSDSRYCLEIYNQMVGLGIALTEIYKLVSRHDQTPTQTEIH